MNINFNDPIEVTEIFRVQKPIFKEEEEKLFDHDEDDFMPARKVERMEITEYSSKTALLWEDIRMIKQYTYKDDWNHLKGEKYWLTLYGHEQDLLILGSYKSMFMLWREFRNYHPIGE